MPLNIRDLLTSGLLIFTFSAVAAAQTSGDVMRERVAKAKAYIAVRNYNAAIYELENIRRETSDPTVNGVLNVLLMNSFLEQGDYKRAQDFLNELSKSNKSNASESYFAVAAQVVKGAKNQTERYRALGLNVADQNLPKEAVADVDKMRETLEKIVEQTKVLSKDKTQTPNAMALMEEATNARGALARDSYDANRWKNETADAREDLASSRSVILSAVNESPVAVAPPTIIASSAPTTATTAVKPNVPIIAPVANTPVVNAAPVFQPVPTTIEKVAMTKPAPVNASPVAEKSPVAPDAEAGSATRPNTAENTAPEKIAVKAEPKKVPPTEDKTEAVKNTSPLEVGSLLGYATQKSNPVYPLIAKNMRLTGIVKIDVVVDENGQVAEVQNLSGPKMLQNAATDAVKKWRFKPFTRDGQATKATGFVSFSFNL